MAVPATAVGQARVCPQGQHCGCLVHQPAGRYTITTHVTAHPPSPPLESHAVQVTARCSHPGEAQSCGRRALTTALIPRRVAIPSRDDPADLESIWGNSGEPVCFPRVCQLYFSLTEGPLGIDALAHSWPWALRKYSFPPVSLLAQTLCKLREDEEQVLLVAPHWPRTDFPHDSTYLAHSSEEGHPLLGARHHMAASRSMEPPCAAPGQDAAHHDAVDGRSLGKHDLIMRFLKGARKMNPSRSPLVPSWDLFIVLAGLQMGPFEPLDSVELKFLSLKTAVLTALSSIKWVGDLQAFSVSEEYLVFGPVYSHIVLRPWLGYMSKVPTTPFRDQVVNLQALPSEEADPALVSPLDVVFMM